MNRQPKTPSSHGPAELFTSDVWFDVGAAAEVLRDAGFEASTAAVDVSSRASVHAVGKPPPNSVR